MSSFPAESTSSQITPSFPTQDVSVIIPTFNRAAYLPRCIKSLESAGIGSMEIIVVDDGSTDDTAEVVASLERDCVYLRQSKQGPAAARNLGFRHSNGRYIAFVDSDDEWIPGAPANAVEMLDTHPEIDVLFADARMGNHRDGFQSWIQVAGEAEFFGLPFRAVENECRILESGPFFRRMAVRNAVFIGATIMRREAFERSGMFDSELCGAADWELWLRMSSRMTFAFFPTPLAIYTRHDECMSNDHDSMREEFSSALEKIRKHCTHLNAEELGLIDRQLRYHLFGHAYAAYTRGDHPEARRRMRHFQAHFRPTPFEYLFLGICHLPPVVARLLRRIRGG